MPKMLKGLYEGLLMDLAWLLPRRLVYYSVVRAWAEASTGPFAETEAGSITVFETLGAWDAHA